MATLQQRSAYLIKRSAEQREKMPTYTRLMAGVTETLDLLDDTLELVADIAGKVEGDENAATGQ